MIPVRRVGLFWGAGEGPWGALGAVGNNCFDRRTSFCTIFTPSNVLSLWLRCPIPLLSVWGFSGRRNPKPVWKVLLEGEAVALLRRCAQRCASTSASSTRWVDAESSKDLAVLWGGETSPLSGFSWGESFDREVDGWMDFWGGLFSVELENIWSRSE